MEHVTGVKREPRRRQPLSQERLDLFIQELELHGVAVEAARAASPASAHPRGSIQSFRDERARNSEFADRWDAAVETANAALEREIVRRGLEGFEEERIDAHGRISVFRKFSDACLLAAARHRLGFAGKSSVEVDQKVTGRVRHDHQHEHSVDLGSMTPEQKHHLRRLLAATPSPDPRLAELAEDN